MQIKDGCVRWDSDDWEQLKITCLDVIEALEVLDVLLDSQILNRVQESNNIETKAYAEAVSKRPRIDLEPVSVINAYSLGDELKHALNNNIKYQELLVEITILNTEKIKINRKIRALTRHFITQNKQFSAKV
jgi:hypothetical protein